MGIFELTLDWDIEYADMDKSVSWNILKKYVKDLKAHNDYVEVYKRRSSSGNTHIKLRYDYELSTLKIYQLRALLRDDIYRLRLDLIRDYNNDETNRLWDFKIKNGEILVASDWERVEV